MTNRVVITGMGAVTPLGNTVDEFWDGLKAGKNGIAPITKFDATETGITVAGELKDFDATNYMQRKISKRMDEFSRYGVAAAVQAVEESGIDREKTDMNRFGVIVGSGIGLYYYLRVMVVMYMTPPDAPRVDAVDHWGQKVGGIMVLLAAAAVLVIGIYPDPIIKLALQSEILSPIHFMLSQQH